MPEFAREIVIRPGGIEIDGEDFPWHILEDGVEAIPPRRGGLGAVRLTIPCARVELIEDRITANGRKSG